MVRANPSLEYGSQEIIPEELLQLSIQKMQPLLYLAPYLFAQMELSQQQWFVLAILKCRQRHRQMLEQ